MRASMLSTKNRTPLVTVLMCVFNSEKFLESAIKSVLDQTFDDFELLVVDDGSTDSSKSIIASFVNKDKRVTATLQEHSGSVISYNTGCHVARGRYIAIMDADDVSMSNRLELQVARMEMHPDIALLGGSTQCIDENGVPLFVMHWPSRDQALYRYLLLDCVISHPTVMYRKSVYDAVGGYRLLYRGAADYDLFLRVSDHHVIDNIPEILCQYRLHDRQVSSLDYTQQVISAIGARLATRARRSNNPEPHWASCPVSRADILAHGIAPGRLDRLVAQYESSIALRHVGWRWSKLPFLELCRSDYR